MPETKAFVGASPGIELTDGALFLGTTRLTPQSETVFINSGLAIEFVLDGQDVPRHLFDRHVSGDDRFDRRRWTTRSEADR